MRLFGFVLYFVFEMILAKVRYSLELGHDHG